jgi:hypothetical protein
MGWTGRQCLEEKVRPVQGIQYQGSCEQAEENEHIRPHAQQFKQEQFMAAFWAVFIFGGSGPAITAHGLLDPKQEIQILIQNKNNCCEEHYIILFKHKNRLHALILQAIHDMAMNFEFLVFFYIL